MAQGQTDFSNADLSKDEQETRIEKLRLEIAALKDQSAWYKPFLEATPLITVLITVAGFWAGAYKFIEEKRSARLSQQSIQIRADIDQILSFPTDKRITLARVTFLFYDLTILTARDVSARVNVTDVVQKLIENDLDFDKLRDASFDGIAMSIWTDYRQRLKQQGGSAGLIYKYYQAFRHLYEENKSYFSSIDYDHLAKQFVVKAYTEETLFLRFAQLVAGYQQHIAFIHSDVERQTAKEKLAEALHNPGLARSLFG